MPHRPETHQDPSRAVAPMDRAKLADAILSSALDCIIVADTQGRITEFNPAAERTFGWSRADMLGRLMEETIVPHHHRVAHHHGMHRYLSGGQPRVVGRRVEVEGLRADGTVFPVELSITETEMEGQHYFVANLRDISAQKATEAELARTQASLKAIFDNIPAALYLRDTEDTLVTINAWGARFLGRSPEEMIGQPMARFREPQNTEGVRQSDAAILRDRQPVTRPFTYHLPGGDRIGLMTFFPVLDPAGEVVQIGGMMMDMTELYTARKELDEARALMQTVFDNIPAELYLRELDGTFVMMNKWGAEFYGSDSAGMVGRSAGEFDKGDEVEIARRAQETLLATGKPVMQQYNYTVAGRDVVVSNTIFPIRDTQGRITHIGGVTTDVTELHQARNELNEARTLLQSIFDNVPAVLYLRELDGRIVTMNKWGASMFGADDPAALIGVNAGTWDDPASAAQARALQDQVLATGKPATQEYRRLLNGREMTILNSIFPVRDAEGAITRIGGFASDVTELYKARNELNEARKLLQSIFDNVPAELYLRKLDGHYIMANKWSLDFYGVTEADLPNLTAESFDVGEETEKSRQAQRELLETGRPVTREYHHTVNGRKVVILNTIFPLRNAEGEIETIGGVSTDITELYNARNQLRQAQENLHQSEKLAALGQLLAGVAHELNNPLAVVLGRAAILQEKLAGTPHEAPLQKLREAASRCARIVKTFLAMARQTGPRREAAEVNELVDSALEMTTYSLRKEGIDWTVTPLPQPLSIEVDEDQIVQVIINLILNAQHALAGQEGPRKLAIEAVLCPSGQWVHLTVADNGPGVPEAIASRIFDPFFTTKAVGEGTGLGLSVCKSMVEAHGGKLVHFATEGGGASFRISLPVASEATPGAGEAGAEGTHARTRGRILIVDDEVEIAAILADCLAPLGIDCTIASDGNQALARLAETAFDGIFCDVSMPGMDGLTFYERLKETNPLLARHLIFISGDVLHREWDRLKAAVDRPVIEKPFDPRQVRDAALALLAR